MPLGVLVAFFGPTSRRKAITTLTVDGPAVDSVLDDRRVRPANNATVSLIRADQVEAEEVEWLWPDRVPFGAITILAGDPGLGKSLLTVWLAAQLSRGDLGKVGAADVLLSSAEDARAQVVVPRLLAAGAAMNRAHFVEMHRGGFDTAPLLPDDAREVAQQVQAAQARLVVFDPLMAHLSGRVNSWKDQEIRAALLPLKVMAEETGAAVVIVAHLNKRQSSDPLERLGGSIGLPAAARSVLLLGRDPADREGGNGRVLAQVKSNLGPRADSLAFQVETVESASVGSIVHIGRSPYAGEDLLAVEQRTRRSKREEARELLAELLCEGARPVSELRAAAEERGISATTLERAKTDLQITPNKASFDRGWIWSLPTQSSTSTIATTRDDEGSQ